jgi:3-phenylpropionate/trans-cinnamate dioxygenase ferredoxin component
MTTRLRVAAMSDLHEDAGMRVEIGEHRIALFRIAGLVYAIGDRCSHAEASLAEGELFGYDVECPRHGSEFDVRTGEPNSLPATRGVPVYEVEVDGDDVFVHIGEGP